MSRYAVRIAFIKRITILLFFTVVLARAYAQQLPPSFKKDQITTQVSKLSKVYLTPVRILWKSDTTGKLVKNENLLLRAGNGQAELVNKPMATLTSNADHKGGILLDFGKEIQGGLQIVTGMMPKNSTVKVRVRFGESAAEAMADTGGRTNATNDHAVRDFQITLPWLGVQEFGNTGFRFVRIDLIDTTQTLYLKEVRAAFIFRDIPYLGSFECSDERLNKIWMAGAYTAHLNMQQYLWDGIKRDRLVWVGDLGPEIATINAVFGNNEVVGKSLDLSRDLTPPNTWMNGLSSYSMWWVLIQYNLYQAQGDLHYLRNQKDYLEKLLTTLSTKIDAQNSEILDGRFLDWPSSENTPAIHAGLQALMVMTFNAGSKIFEALNDAKNAVKYQNIADRLSRSVPPVNKSKQAAALLALADMMPARVANQVIATNGGHNFSTYYGYYMLQAMAKAQNYGGALDIIRQYWGAMLDVGATTFWEDFNLDWLKNAGRIDELVPAGKIDIHGAYGAYCYLGFRHSLCHGWASGPTAWLSEHVLGIKVLKAGCKRVKIEPHLGDLQFARGTFPTPYGLIKVSHMKLKSGRIKTLVTAPKQIEIVK